MKSFLDEIPHRRYNPLIREWILCSPHRAKRPWQGKNEDHPKSDRPAHDKTCYLCAGNSRANGVQNPDYKSTYVFENDFPALLESNETIESEHELLKVSGVRGTCRVICFSPRHDLTLAGMDLDAIQSVIRTWRLQAEELGQKYRWVQIFENKGAIMGCSNPHPHGQIWAMDQIPSIPQAEDSSQKDYTLKNRRRLLLDYAEVEMERRERIVCENNDWLVVVPFWATWPFETLLMPKFEISRITELDDKKGSSLAEIMKALLSGYDRLFNCEFPYSMGWHGAPFDSDGSHWQLHAHFYPPLLRSATIKKFMVGFEMLAEAQRDITPESAAARLKLLVGEN